MGDCHFYNKTLFKTHTQRFHTHYSYIYVFSGKLANQNPYLCWGQNNYVFVKFCCCTIIIRGINVNKPCFKLQKNEIVRLKIATSLFECLLNVLIVQKTTTLPTNLTCHKVNFENI